MPVQAADDFDFSPEPKSVAVVVSKDDPSKGVVRVTLRPLPDGKWPALSALYNASQERASKLSDIADRVSRGAHVTPAEADEWGGFVADRLHVNTEIVRWGVAGHEAADFLKKDGTPIPFESATEIFNREVCTVASPRMVQYYRNCRLLESLSDAVAAFQANVIFTPEEVWEQRAQLRELMAAQGVAAYLRAVVGATEEATPAGDPPLPPAPLT